MLSGLCPQCSTNIHLEPARRRVFCASLADVFDNEVDPAWRADLFALIGATPNLDWLLLTKRISNVTKMLGDVLTELQLRGHDPLQWPWPNVWIGSTVCNQAEADRDIPKLLETPASVKFLSMEPLLGPVDLMPMFEHRADVHADTGIDWVIAGGESGAHARPMSPDWVRSLRDQCAAAGVPFLFKQWGEWIPMLGQVDSVSVRPCKATIGDGWVMGWAGKKAAGRRLDGREHNNFPFGGHRG